MFCELEYSVFREGVCNLIFGYNHILLEYFHGHDLACFLVSTHHHLGEEGERREEDRREERREEGEEGEREEGKDEGKKGRKCTSNFGDTTQFHSSLPSQTSPFPALSAFQSPPFSVDTAEKLHTHTHTRAQVVLTLVEALFIASCIFLGRDSRTSTSFFFSS